MRIMCLVIGCALVLSVPAVGQANSNYSETSEYLYQLAEEYRKAGNTDQAVHELHKLLLLDPGNKKAKRQLALLERRQRAQTPIEPIRTDGAYQEAFNRGIQAFQRGDLAEAARAFQEAYLIRPTDSKLLSWMALVKDEQARRGAMTRTLEDLTHKPAKAKETKEAKGEEEAALPTPPISKKGSNQMNLARRCN